jgi:hypothetical protein
MTDRPAERTATRTGAHAGRGDDTAARPPLADRIQAKLASTVPTPAPRPSPPYADRRRRHARVRGGPGSG